MLNRCVTFCDKREQSQAYLSYAEQSKNLERSEKRKKPAEKQAPRLNRPQRGRTIILIYKKSFKKNYEQIQLRYQIKYYTLITNLLIPISNALIYLVYNIVQSYISKLLYYDLYYNLKIFLHDKTLNELSNLCPK